MSHPLRLLILEDSPGDAELMAAELRQAGYDLDWQRVETEPAYVAALSSPPDVILADHTLPHFDAEQALLRLNERSLDIPFIVVSGTIHEELAVLLMKNGASDYVWKDRIRRLGPAVGHALEQCRLRTEQRLAEQRVRESEAWFRALIEKIHDGISVLDADATLTYVSPSTEHVLGYQPDELVGKSLMSLVHPDDLPGYRCAFEELVRQAGTGRMAAHRMRHRDGSWQWVESVGANHLGESPVNGIVCTFRDVTERKRAEAELHQAREAAEHASRVKSRFLASMSHELRNPLNSIIGFTGILLMRLSGPLNAEQERQLQIAEKSAHHLLSLINGMLELNRLESGRYELTWEPLDCKSVVAEVLQSRERAARGKGLTLERSLPADDLVLCTDRRALSEILSNLVDNAIKHTERGEVRVGVEATICHGRRFVQFHLTDTGNGMSEADQACMVGPCEQWEGDSKTLHGTGLGLYLCRRLTNLLGGDIGFSSQCGRGTTLTLSVPEQHDGNHSCSG